MTSSLIKCSLAIALSGFLAACSSSPKSSQPVLGAAKSPSSAHIVNTSRGPSLTLDDVLFDFEQTSLRAEADQTVERAVSYLENNPDHNAIIEGHTDHIGESTYNQYLSTKRSDAIAEALIASGIDPDRIKTVGFGESKPIADNSTVEGRRSNRRVEIIFTEK